MTLLALIALAKTDLLRRMLLIVPEIKRTVWTDKLKEDLLMSNVLVFDWFTKILMDTCLCYIYKSVIMIKFCHKSNNTILRS